MAKNKEVEDKTNKKDEAPISISNNETVIVNKVKVRKRTFQGKKLISIEMVEPKVRK